ncbi:hypothetical protein P3T23_009777, partial [Paraburkholderia sp. GAS448]
VRDGVESLFSLPWNHDSLCPGMAVLFAWNTQVDDVPGIRRRCPFEQMHVPRPHFSTCTGSRVGVEIVRKHLPELQGKTAAHDPDAVHRIHDGFDIHVKDVPINRFDHC